MQKNPFNESAINQVIGILAVITAWAVFTVLLCFYSKAGWEVALPDSLVSVGLLAIIGYFYSYIEKETLASHIRILLPILIQIVCLAGAFGVHKLLTDHPVDVFLFSLPLRITFGLLCWVILAQWLDMNQVAEEEIEEETEPQEVIKEETPQIPKIYLEHVKVKDSLGVHIVHLEELFYIKSKGNKVTLFTPTEELLKRQSMKFFRENLPPDQFISISRTCIINKKQIDRFELFGGTNRLLYLKNGACLNISYAGYQNLREKLKI